VGTFDYPLDYCRNAFILRDAKAVQEACRTLFAKVDASMQPSLYDEVAAASMEKKMTPDEPVPGRNWARLRNARWVYSVWRQLPPGAEGDEAAEVRALRTDGELAYVKSLIAAAHMPVEAPRTFVTKEPQVWKQRESTDSRRKPNQGNP
jgi:hypothetical protein